MSVAVSRDSFVVENLGLDAMNDIRIGIFRTPQERHEWSYEDSFAGTIPLLSAGQTVTKRMGEFHSRSRVLDFSDGGAAYVDCWLEDNHRIYLERDKPKQEYRDRYQLIGTTLGGRRLKIIFQLKPKNIVRIITGWQIGRAHV